MTVPTRTPEEFAALLDRCAHTAEGMGERLTDTYRVADLIAERDEAIRADERVRCSVVHAPLTDEALVDELVRRGVLTEDDGGACDADARTHSVNCSCFGGSGRQRRYVTEWEPDTRTPQQRSDDAVDEMRRRLKGDAP